MTHRSRLGGICIDCRTDDLPGAAAFWAAVFRSTATPGGGPYVRLEPQRGVSVEVQKVAHESRVHVDIETDDVAAEVARLEDLGARRIEAVQDWVVMEAPTGQRFCVVPEDGEPQAAGQAAEQEDAGYGPDASGVQPGARPSDARPPDARVTEPRRGARRSVQRIAVLSVCLIAAYLTVRVLLRTFVLSVAGNDGVTMGTLIGIGSVVVLAYLAWLLLRSRFSGWEISAAAATAIAIPVLFTYGFDRPLVGLAALVAVAILWAIATWRGR